MPPALIPVSHVQKRTTIYMRLAASRTVVSTFTACLRTRPTTLSHERAGFAMTQRQLAASSTALDADHATGASGAESLELEGIVLDDTAELQVSCRATGFSKIHARLTHDRIRFLRHGMHFRILRPRRLIRQTSTPHMRGRSLRGAWQNCLHSQSRPKPTYICELKIPTDPSPSTSHPVTGYPSSYQLSSTPIIENITRWSSATSSTALLGVQRSMRKSSSPSSSAPRRSHLQGRRVWKKTRTLLRSSWTIKRR